MNTTSENNKAASASGNGRSSHRVITFYSYKGGVGRSMAVANVALLLAREHGLQVLAVDWDLEAPGLHRYFNMSDDDLGKGVIDYLDNYKTLIKTPKDKIRREDLSITPYLREVTKFGSGGSLRLLGAGLQQTKSEYVDKVRGFDWADFYGEWNGAQLIEAVRNEFLDVADVTIVDSRTGITDVGGVCTVQLPDTVVFVFVFNRQNLDGIEQVANELSNENNPALKALKRRPELLFLPCRKELTELARLRRWEGIAADQLGKFCRTDKILHRYGDVVSYLRKSSVPYVPYFAYGEELAADSERGPELAEAFEPLISLLLEEPEISRKTTQVRWAAIARRKMILYAGAVAVISAALLVFFLYPSALSNQNWSFFVKTAVAGILGASLSSISRSQLLAKEDPWRLDSRYITVSLLGDTVGGCLIGLIVGLFAPSRYYILASAIAGFFWRSFSHNLLSGLTGRASASKDR